MSAVSIPQKPRAVLYAELALWAWTAWFCLYGILETWRGIPELEQALGDQLQGMISIAPGTLLAGTIIGYALLSALSAWIVFEIGKGKHWARSSLLWGIGLEIVTIVIPPYHPLLEYLSSIPDLGLQIYAAHLLYTPPGSGWFGAHGPKK
jgi:hypothetical protein